MQSMDVRKSKREREGKDCGEREREGERESEKTGERREEKRREEEWSSNLHCLFTLLLLHILGSIYFNVRLTEELEVYYLDFFEICVVKILCKKVCNVV